jgi:uncharacterized protein YciI
MQQIAPQALYIAQCRDHTDGRATENRMRVLAAHLAYIESIIDRIAIAGPLRDVDGKVVGSVLMYRVATLQEARALLHADPYFSANIWSHTEVCMFVGVAGDWAGGKAW